MKHSIKHDLSPDVAKKVAEKAFESYAARFTKYSPTASWPNPNLAKISFTAKGVTLNGTIELKPGEIELELKVPFLFKVFQGKAIGIINEEIQNWIAKAKAGEI